jgi:hypothetical protein
MIRLGISKAEDISMLHRKDPIAADGSAAFGFASTSNLERRDEAATARFTQFDCQTSANRLMTDAVVGSFAHCAAQSRAVAQRSR